MSAPFDDQPRRQANQPRAPRPKDAATLILVRRERGVATVLMGQRAHGHVFMPNKWVFPGGAVDPGDGLTPAASELRPEDHAQLLIDNPRRKPRAFALAAIREMFEEAGLVVGRRGAIAGKAPRGWADYAAHDAAPELHKLTFVARAITPPMSPRRYDARFFMADADEALLDDRPLSGDEELLQLRWFTLEEAATLDLPSITRSVLKEIQSRLDGETPRPIFFRFTNGKGSIVRL
jgi:8-oxo-dGTP pyrophosphatase MutT (NUDIX family)